jgi:23S rRNA pseudouridine1911/1915/1917 synthase
MLDDRRRPQAEPLELRVVYEDEWVLALDKPAGMVVHPTYKNTTGTLLNGVLWRMRGRDDASPGILTRLDKDTSGLVVIGLTSASHATMQKDAHAGRMTKQYLAVVRGQPRPREGRIVLPLARDLADRRLVVVRDDGQACETRYETLSTTERGEVTGPPAASAPSALLPASPEPWQRREGGPYTSPPGPPEGGPHMSLLQCEPITGRTHQIRVHLAARGWPVIGDRVYGEADSRIGRQALHAWKVALPHPVTRQRLELEAAVPEDLGALLQNFTL